MMDMKTDSNFYSINKLRIFFFYIMILLLFLPVKLATTTCFPTDLNILNLVLNTDNS